MNFSKFIFYCALKIHNGNKNVITYTIAVVMELVPDNCVFKDVFILKKKKLNSELNVNCGECQVKNNLESFSLVSTVYKNDIALAELSVTKHVIILSK